MMTQDALGRIARALQATAESHPFLPLIPAEVEEASRAYFTRGGKHLRPALCLALAHALGGDEASRRALSPALATELFHLFTLVHDDVIDHDTLRRGGDAAHVLAQKKSGIADEEKAAEYGVSASILAGDALFSRAVELLSEAEGLSEDARLLLIRRLSADTLPRLLSGEATDTKLAYLEGIPSEEELSTVYQNKTGVLFAFALYAGAVCAANGRPDETLVSALETAAIRIGVAFQLTDDYLSLTAGAEKTGKNHLSDIREGKRTFFVHFAAARATQQERETLLSTLGDRTASEKAVLYARDLLLRYGEEPYKARIREAQGGADALLDLLGEGDAKELLRALFIRMIHREN